MNVGASAAAVGTRLRSFASDAPNRFHEPAFWWIQAAIAVVTAAHAALEMNVIDIHPANLMHLPVTLYVLPIAFAGLHYGVEGSALAGLEAIALTIPNVWLSHGHSAEWFGEMSYVMIAVALGILVAVPVERERGERRRAEATGRRLAVLNSVLTHLGYTADFTTGLDRTVSSLVDDLEAAGAAVAIRPINGRQVIAAAGARAQDASAAASSALDGFVATEPPGSGSVVVRVDPPGGGAVSVALLSLEDRELAATDRDVLPAVARYISVAHEVDRLRSSEADRLRSYAREMTRAQEAERTRMARELHDDVAQQLIVLCRDLESPPVAAADNRAHGLAERARTILSLVRRFSRELRPSMLDDLGLVPALQSIVGDLQTRTGARSSLSVAGRPQRLAEDVEITLFRIVQEALHNVERHAGATSVDVAVRFEGDHVRVAVVDDGRGFEPGGAIERAREDCYGLLGMEERARLVGGHLRVTSSRGGGCTVDFDLPLVAASAASVA